MLTFCCIKLHILLYPNFIHRIHFESAFESGTHLADTQLHQFAMSQTKLSDLSNYFRFIQTHSHVKKLGAGGDGTVSLWKHKRSGVLVAVKTPNQTYNPTPCSALTKEAKALELLGKHPHIVEILAYLIDFKPRGPAVLLEYAPLGDLRGYQAKVFEQFRLCAQLAKQKIIEQVPEETVCKLLGDMALALKFLHGEGFVHADFKPENILVCYPDGWADDNDIPTRPVFKLTDFSRMTPFPLPLHIRNRYYGTPEYGPPPEKSTNKTTNI
ncbi:SPS1 Serine threonine protein kinase [Pyrenophora tritici-repentis]|nr:SPS1 Serine threonine protein kinase [Pyrenophora tritici-repentis]